MTGASKLSRTADCAVGNARLAAVAPVRMVVFFAALVAVVVGGAVPASSSASQVPPRWGAPVRVGQVSLSGTSFWATQIAVADFNGDGHQDILIARDARDAQHTLPVTILLGDGKGGFTDGTSSILEGDVPRTQYPRQIVIADFNGDRRPDVFIADTGGDHAPFPGYQNTLILSAPGGKLVDATANLPQVDDYTHSAAAADVNGDGATDLYIGNIYGANQVPPRILLNDGTGHFSELPGALPAAQASLDQNTYTGGTFADVNGDGHPDLVLAASNQSQQSVVLLNDGTGHFTELAGALPPKPFGTDAIGFDPTTLDINRDGHPGLVISYTKGNPFYVGRWIQVLINNGNGTFEDETASRLPQSDNSDPWAEWIQPRDLQHDGSTDFGLQANPLLGGPPLLYLLDQNGSFHQGPAIGVSVLAWAFIDPKADGSNDIVGVTISGDVLLVPELRQTIPLALSALKLTPRAFRSARSGATTTRAGVGTTISYQDSAAATTTFTVDRALPGIKLENNCIPAPRHPGPGGQRCTRFVPMPGSFTHADNAGLNHFRFTGRIGGKSLTPSNYRLDAAPSDTAGDVGPTAHALFTVVR